MKIHHARPIMANGWDKAIKHAGRIIMPRAVDTFACNIECKVILSILMR